MSEIIWGTGYGSKRHIPDVNGIQEPRDNARRGTTRSRRYAVAACSMQIFIDTFADGADRDLVMAKTPCTRCAKKAGVIPCPTCTGSGVVTP